MCKSILKEMQQYNVFLDLTQRKACELLLWLLRSFCKHIFSVTLKYPSNCMLLKKNIYINVYLCILFYFIWGSMKI